MSTQAQWFLVVVGAVLIFGCSDDSTSGEVMHDCQKDSSGDVCFCSAYLNGDPPATSIVCSPEAFPGTICCATPSWPNLNGTESGECECAPPEGAPPGCPNDSVFPELSVQMTSCEVDATALTGGGTGGAGSGSCTDTGYCGPSTDACDCGTSCVHYGAGEYLCGFTCTNDSDCSSRTNPLDGTAYTHCTPGLETATMTYDGFCG